METAISAMNSDRMKAHLIYTLWLAKWYFYANQFLLLHASYRAGNVDDCAYFGNPFQFFSKLHFTFPYRFHLANWKFFFISFFFSISIGFLMKFSKKFCDMRAFEIGRYWRFLRIPPSGQHTFFFFLPFFYLIRFLTSNNKEEHGTIGWVKIV